MSKKIISLILAVMMALGCTALAEEAKTYDFSEQAQAYMEYMGTNLTNRNAVPEGTEVPEGNTHQETVDWILSELKNAGYTDEDITCEVESVTTPWGMTIPVQNIIVKVTGADPAKQIIIGAHYDGDGVGDNASGAALLLANCCGLKNEVPACNVQYVFFDAEEMGLVGASHHAASLTEEEAASTLFMLNMDSLAFGDYANIYGGVQNEDGTVTETSAYDLAVEKAKALGINVMTTADLDGYYAANGAGPEIAENTLYTNPWTPANPAPANGDYFSPATGDWSDHADYKYLGIPYVYFEATNWYAAGDGGEDAYTGYFETTDTTLGYDGMFMNTEFDTLENLNSFFPGRSLAHFQVFSPLLSALILEAE